MSLVPRNLSYALILLGVFLLAGCFHDEADSDELISLNVFPASIKITSLDQVVSLKAVSKDKKGSVSTNLIGLEWKSSNEDVVSVSDKGEIVVNALGEANVTVSYEGFTDVSSIVVDQSGDVIDGLAKYEDRQYDVDGFTGVSFKSVRYATAELLNENGDVISRSSTDDVGAFQFGNVIPDKYSIRLISEVKNSPAAGFSVKDMNGLTYSFTKKSVDGTLSYSINLSRSTPGAGVFNLLDVITTSAEYAHHMMSTDVEDLSVFWEKNYDLGGTYYCTGFGRGNCFNGAGIYIISEIATRSNNGILDTDEFDDDVIMHEFAHYLAENYSADDSIGGYHRLTQNDSDLRLSWSEGWGMFFPTAVKTWLKVQNPLLISSEATSTTFIDSIGNVAYLSFDLASGEEGDSYYYASSEVAVSRILWNVLDNFGLELGIAKIWDVMANYFPISDKPTSLPSFWDGLLASDLYSSGELPVLEGIFAERKVLYQTDVSELDDTLATATTREVGVTPDETSTIYSDDIESDVDFFSFNAVKGTIYKIATSQLYNGIDTEIRLYDESGTLLAENDDVSEDEHIVFDEYFNEYRISNGPSAMASEINFKAIASEKYYVSVQNAEKQSSVYNFVGHYGSYKLIISSE